MAGLQDAGIPVGLVSGRDLPRLEKIVLTLGTRGPLIAENGSVARLRPDGPLVDLGYSRRQALEAVAILKSVFQDAIVELEDNKNRLVDVTISSGAISVAELKKYTPGIQILDSGYMLHLMPENINKGQTLLGLLPKMGLSSDQVMVFGDSKTDLPLFRVFENSVLVHNPLLSYEQELAVQDAATYESKLPVENGFCQVVDHILRKRVGPEPHSVREG